MTVPSKQLSRGSTARSARSALWSTVLSVAVLTALVGCAPPNAPANPTAAKPAASGDPAAGTPAATPAATTAAPAAATAGAIDPNGGTITGTVVFTGNPPPKPPPIQMGADKNCAAMHTGPVFPDEVTINENGTLKYTFVYVSAGLEGKTFTPAEPVLFDQRGCRYEPHVFGVQVKQKLVISNSDSTLHNVHGLAGKKNPDFNKGMPNKDMKITQVFNKPEMKYKIKCEVHPWMLAWCHIMEHPFFSTSDEKGEFKIAGLPPGKYTLTALHESLGEQKQEIEVAAKDAKTVKFEFKGQ